MGKVTVHIDKDERYPDYHFSERYGEAVEVDAETAERWRQVTADFNRVQDEMEAAYDAANEAKYQRSKP